MRITNSMMSNTMLININRNMKNLDTLLTQYSTTKSINVASDDPIKASRALKFRTNVAETMQYQRNVEQGMSWMEVTEGSFNNVVEILKGVRDRCEQAATGTLEYKDKQTIMAQLSQYMQQLGSEMNQTYAGRYVFSGFRTDQEPVLQKDSSKSYTIEQSFGFKDIEQCTTSQRSHVVPAASVYDQLLTRENVNIIKLPYDKLDATPTINIVTPGTPPTSVGVPVTQVSTDPGSNKEAYDISADPDGIYFVKETGELVIGANVASKLAAGQTLDVEYEKTGFKQGELNPMVYFTCMDNDTGKSYDMEGQSLKYEFSVNTLIQVNSLGKDVYTPGLYADLKNLIDEINSLEPSSLEDLISKGLSPDEANAIIENEKQAIQEVMHNRFDNMLKLIDNHVSVVSKEQTDLGSRMNRLEMIQARLEQDEESYTKLLSENEDADMYQVIMLLSNAQAVYDASLKAGMSVIQMSLANFI